jgi:hypothetical protein
MKFSKWGNRVDSRQNGEILPMALVLLAAVIFVIIPGLFAAQVALGVDRDTEKDTRSYYAAEAGISDAVWKFKTYPGTAPFTPTSSVGSSYNLSNTINGLTVQVALLKYSYTNTNNYFIQSSALLGTTTQAKIVALITQSGSTGNNVFNEAVAALNGDISMDGGAKIISDNSSSGNYGNIYANGNVTVKSAYVGGTKCPSSGIASATGTVSTTGGGCVGTAVNSAKPVSYALTVSDFSAPADAGTNYTSLSASWGSGGSTYNNIGPGYVQGNLTIAGSNIIVLTGNLHVKGSLEITAGAQIKGPYTVISDGNLAIDGGSSAILASGNIPFFITTVSDTGGHNPTYAVNIGGSSAIAAVIYAPNGTAYLSGGTNTPPGYNVYGSVIAKSVYIHSMTIEYMTGIHSESQIPGAGTGGTASLMRYDYR